MKKFIVLAMAVVLTLAFAGLGYSLKKDVEIKAVGDEGKVTFSHENHTEKQGFKCATCHPKVFKMKAGGDTITMADIKAGKFCGTCHDGKDHDGKTAFDASAADSCPKCHKK